MISAVILAAGRSTRMGRLKQLLPYREHTVIEQVILVLLASPVDEALVVTGHERMAVEAALASEDWAKAESLADELVFLNPAHPDIDRIRSATSEGRKPKVSAAAPKPRVKPRAKTTGKQKPQAAAPAAPAAWKSRKTGRSRRR